MTNVYLFVPNLIGYARVLLAFIAFWAARTNPWIFAVAYSASELLDQWDGHAARAFNQCSRFGAVLDMVTDRCSTTSLLVVLALWYQDWVEVFIFVIALDLASHYAHLYSSLSKGLTSHKSVDETMFTALRYYYGNRYLLYVMCFGNEMAFVSLYINHWFPHWQIPYVQNAPVTLPMLAFWIAFPVCFAKQAMNLLQFIQAAKDTVAIDRREIAEKARLQAVVSPTKSRSAAIVAAAAHAAGVSADEDAPLKKSPSRRASTKSPARSTSVTRRTKSHRDD